jgi:uncharacterized membrane-anchored protein YhcB (DUF1043 family)
MAKKWCAKLCDADYTMYSLLQVAMQKDKAELQVWTADIVTHFWKCSELADGDVRKFKV